MHSQPNSDLIIEAQRRHPEFVPFVLALAEKLDANKYKLERPKLPVEALIKLLKAEIIELEVAFEYEGVHATMKEAADVANFAFLIYRRLHTLTERS